MSHNKSVKPFVKWVGGKRQLLPAISEHLPPHIKRYYEPFVGGGAMLFHLQPEKATINDLNSELINVYLTIKNKLPDLLEDLHGHKNESDYFYEIRRLDRTEKFANLTDVQRASRMIFLNKTCFNGLYRVNSAGEFNSPFGNYKNPNIVNEITLRAVHSYLNENQIEILNGSYKDALKGIRKGAFVYFDPPYDPVSQSANFTGYTRRGFDRDDQVRLKELCDKLDKRGVNFLVSNSSTPFIRELYGDNENYHVIEPILANRAINSNGAKRGKVAEVLVKNYAFKK